VNAALRFLVAKGILDWNLHSGSHTRVIHEDSIRRVGTSFAGILKRHAEVGDEVGEGDLLCEIIHPLEGNTVGKITAPVEGTVFFSYNKQLVMEHTDVFRIIPISDGEGRA
jgi:predicted deacylase